IVIGNRVYMGYGTSSNGIFQILDRDKLLNGPPEPTEENLLFPQIARYEVGELQGAHTVLPLLGIQVPEFKDFVNGNTRDVLALVNEAGGNQCQGASVQMMYVVDI